MHSKLLTMSFAFAIASFWACTSDLDPEAVTLSASVGEVVVLPLETEGFVVEARADWVIVEAPEGSEASVLRTGPRTGTLKLDKRGRFLVDRWLSVGASERWTHRYVVDTVNAPPVAGIDDAQGASVGFALTLSGLASRDSETAPEDLQYLWILAFRPRNSTAILVDDGAPTVTLTPDVTGRYTIKLSVFDGELWSEETSLDVLVLE